MSNNAIICKLNEFTELNINIENKDNPISVTLTKGTAEYLGYELIPNKEYRFYYNHCFLITFHGCEFKIQLNGNPISCYSVQNNNIKSVCHLINSWQNWFNNNRINSKSKAEANLKSNIVLLSNSSSSDSNKLFIHYALAYYIRMNKLTTLNINHNSNQSCYVMDLVNRQYDSISIGKLNLNSGLVDIPLFDELNQFELNQQINCLITTSNNKNQSDIYTQIYNEYKNTLDNAFVIIIASNIMDEWDKISQCSNIHLPNISTIESNIQDITNWSNLKNQNNQLLYFHNRQLVTPVKDIYKYVPRPVKLLFKANQWIGIKADNGIGQFKPKQIVAVGTCISTSSSTQPQPQSILTIVGFIYIENIINNYITFQSPVADSFPNHVKFYATPYTYS